MLRIQRLTFVIPKEREDFWPYYGVFFADEYEPLLRNIRHSDIVIDAGAHVGFFTVPAALKAKEVIAVEPAPDSFKVLAKNIKLNGLNNVILINKALSDYEGIGYMSGKGLSATLSRAGTLMVKVTTIDALLKSLRIDHVDVIKMDIEGSEVRALKGRFLDRVRIIVVETHGDRNEKAVRTILNAKGFKINTWRFSAGKCLMRIVKRIPEFVLAEFAVNFAATRATLKYLLGLGNHPVAPTDPASGVKLLIGYKELDNHKAQL